MPSVVHQAAVIAVRDGEVCLVTSRSGRRWVIPKGKIEPRQSAGDAALTEAWEEAGLLGTLSDQPVGTFEYRKEGRSHRVTVFVLHVETARDSWPEQHERLREWVALDEAITRIDEPELKDIVRGALQTQSEAVVRPSLNEWPHPAVHVRLGADVGNSPEQLPRLDQ